MIEELKILVCNSLEEHRKNTEEKRMGDFDCCLEEVKKKVKDETYSVRQQMHALEDSIKSEVQNKLAQAAQSGPGL